MPGADGGVRALDLTRGRPLPGREPPSRLRPGQGAAPGTFGPVEVARPPGIVDRVSTTETSADLARAERRPLSTIERWLVGLELVLAVSAAGGAFGLISGTLDLRESADDLPWSSPVFGGIALGLLICLLPAAVAVLTLRRHRWAPTGHVVVGVTLVGWIVVQVGFIGPNSALQLVMFLLGAVILVLGQRARREARR